MAETQNFIDFDTLDGGDAPELVVEAAVPTLTIAAHPHSDRAGEAFAAPELGKTRGLVEISRAAPAFRRASDGRERPLVTPFVSRKPVRLVGSRDGGIVVDPGAGSAAVVVDGNPVTSPTKISRDTLAHGVTLEIGRYVVLVLDLRRPAAEPGDDLGMLGVTDVMARLRQAIRRAAPSELPVLVRGETGAGKELAARAIHRLSPRTRGPFVAVNMAAVPASLAASELFGHTRGAFSGAQGDHDGYFARADGGTLFLDEIGDAPDEVQTALLRVLETGEIQRIGARRMQRVDVRLVAATDADLEGAAGRGAFRAPLLYRLATQELKLPPLRERRADVGILLVAFLRERLEAVGLAERLTPPLTERAVWLSAPLVARLVRYDWPGNVRQLRNVAHALAARAPEATPLAADDPEILRLLHGVDEPSSGPDRPTPDAPVATPAPSVHKKPRDIEEDELYTVMERVDFKLSAAAKHFGISSPSINALVDAHPRLVRASQLSADAIEAARARAGDRPLWRVLEVSERGLARRMKALGLS